MPYIFRERERENLKYQADCLAYYRAPEYSTVFGQELDLCVSDMFALGVILFQLVYGEHPFTPKKVDLSPSSTHV